jgi:hypothetical protein
LVAAKPIAPKVNNPPVKLLGSVGTKNHIVCSSVHRKLTSG